LRFYSQKSFDRIVRRPVRFVCANWRRQIDRFAYLPFLCFGLKELN
jgi:hypothetical protein